MTVEIDRAFVRLSEGLVHLRRVDGVPTERSLCLIHLSPGSSRSLEGLMHSLRAVGFSAPLIAPDTLGNGGSAPPAHAEPDIFYFAGSLARVLDQLGIDRVDLFGSHTGARIACEFALTHPDRTGRVVMDGIVEYPPETRTLFRQRYTPRVEPDPFGGQLLWAFNYMRNQHLFFPWFMQDASHRLDRTLPTPQALHEATLDLLNSLATYPMAYGAAFDYPSDSKVPALPVPTLLLKRDGGSAAVNNAAEGYANGVNIHAVSIGDSELAIAEAVASFLKPGYVADKAAAAGA